MRLKIKDCESWLWISRGIDTAVNRKFGLQRNHLRPMKVEWKVKA